MKNERKWTIRVGAVAILVVSMLSGCDGPTGSDEPTYSNLDAIGTRSSRSG